MTFGRLVVGDRKLKYAGGYERYGDNLREEGKKKGVAGRPFKKGHAVTQLYLNFYLFPMTYDQ